MSGHARLMGVGVPILKQFGDLTSGDFEDHPVWASCGSDADELWYDDTDEETFRPWTAPLPADPSLTMVLLRAAATLSDGTQLHGFLTPADAPAMLRIMQPQVFVGEAMFGFWGGMAGIPDEYRRRFHVAVGKDESQVFPIRFEADPALSGWVTHALVDGWPDPLG